MKAFHIIFLVLLLAGITYMFSQTATLNANVVQGGENVRDFDTGSKVVFAISPILTGIFIVGLIGALAYFANLEQ